MRRKSYAKPLSGFDTIATLESRMSRANVMKHGLAVVIGVIAVQRMRGLAPPAAGERRPRRYRPRLARVHARQLAGTWTLTRFEVLNAAGQLTAVRAKAQLTYDDFGNLSIKGVLEEPLPGQTSIGDAPALAYSGRATIDTARKELVLTGATSVEPSPEVLASIGMDQRTPLRTDRHVAHDVRQLTRKVA